MAQVGIVKTLEGGVFYAKDSSGNIRELSIGDSISENEVVYGDSSNQTSAKVEMELSGNDIIVLNQAQQQLIDSSLNQVTFGNEEVIFSKGDINTTFENADLSAWNNTTDDVSDDMETAAGDPTQQETQAGEEEPTEEGRVTARFSARDGSSTDVRSDLRDTIDFGTQSSENVNDDEIAAELLNPQATTTEPTTPTIPVDTRVEASKITLSNPTVDEGKDITITATVDNAPQTDLVITLNNGEKITIKAGETTGSTTFTNPNTEDVYKDSSTETYTISGTEGGNYKDLDISDKSTVKVTDTEDTVTVKLTATPSTTEGGEITYTVTLVDAKGNPVDTKTGVTVELSNGKTITIDANSSSKSLTIDAETDDVYVDAKDVSVSIKDVIETNKGAENSFEKLVADKTPVDTKVTDTEDTVTVKLTATPSTTEGGEITYTVTLVDAKGNPVDTKTGVTVELSNGKTITIDANSSSKSLTIDAETDDVYVDAKDVSVSIKDVIETNKGAENSFEKLVADKTPVDTKVTDTEDTVTVKLTATPSTTEGGEITYTVTLVDAKGNPVDTKTGVTVELSNGKTITIDANSSSKSLTIDAETDDVYVDAKDVSVSIKDVIETNKGAENSFEKLVADKTPVDTKVTDTEDTVTVKLTATPSTTEGGEITYTVTLVDAKGNPVDTKTGVTVELSNGKTITIDANSSSKSLTIDAETDDVYVDAKDVSVSIKDVIETNKGAENSFEKLVADKTPVDTKVTDTEDTVTVKLTATPSTTEGGEITYTVTLVDAKGNPVDTKTGVTVELSNGKTITIDANSSSKSLTIDAETDDVYVDAKDVSVSIKDVIETNKGAENSFEKLVADKTPVDTKVTDTEDTVTVKLTATPSTTEGGEITYTVTLVDAKGNPVDTKTGVTVELSNGKTITIDANSSSKSLTIDAETDDVYVDAKDVSVSIKDVIETNKGAENSFEKLVADKTPVDTKVTDTEDTVTVKLTATPSTTEGGEITYTVTLVDAKGNPVDTKTGVTVELSNGKTITIDANSSSKSLTIDAETDDVYVDAKDVSVSIKDVIETNKGAENSFEKLVADKTPVDTKVTDTEDTVTVKLTATPSTTEGGEITYTVTLVDAKGNPVDTKTGVTVELSNGKTITIDANSSSKSLTIDAETDDVYVDAKDVSVSIKDVIETNKGAENSFEKLVADKTPVDTKVTDTEDTVTVKLTATPSTTEGGEITYTVTLVDAKGNPVDTKTGVTVELSNGKTITIDANSSSKSLTIDAETDDVYVDAKDVSVSIKDVIETNKGAENSFEKLVADKTPVDTKVTDTEDTVTVKLTATPSTTEGGEITYTVTLVDAKGNPVDTKTGVTVELSNGKTITIDANSSSKSLTIDAETDDVYVDAKDVSVSIKDVIETNKGAENSFEKLVADKTPVDTKVTDTEDTVTVKLTATPSTTEGGEITYTVTLVDAKGNPVDTKTGVTVELSNGKTITIDANSSSKSLTIDAETDDVYVDAKDVSVSIKDVIETNKGAENSFEKLVADKTPVDTKVTDTEDTVTVKLTATPSTTEGGEITYTVTLVDAKGNPVDTKTGVTVELSNGKTITIDANSSSKSLTIDAETDDVYVDAKDVSVSIKDVIETNKGAENSFEKLVADKTPVDTKVTDTEDTVTVKLTATPSTTEGGEITYTVTLVDAKGNPVDTKTGVTVELSNGKTITIDANSSSKSLTIDAETDDVYVDAKDVSVSIKDVIETNKGAENSFEKLVADKTPVDTKVTDTEDTVTVKLTATPSTTEGGEITYTVTLVDAKGNPVDTKTGVTVELSNGKTITIDANSSSKSLTIDAETDDVYVDAKDVSVSIKDVIETNKGAENSFEKLVADKTPVDTKVTDTEDTVTVKLTATPSTTEGGEITYTVTLVDAKGNPVDTKTGVTVELSNGKTITIDANSSSKSLTIDAETDDVYVDAKDVSVSIKDVIETNKGAENSFEKLVADKTPVDTKVTDTEDTVTVKLTATPSTTEGGEITYTVTLVDAKGNPVDTKTGVTVELSNGKTITIDANSSSKSLTIDAETDDVYVDAKDVSVSIKDVIETNKGAENSFEKLVADKTPVDTKVTDTEDTVTVKLTATPSTTEGGEITYTVTLVDAKGNPVDTKTGVTVELSNGKTITIDANSSSKSLTIDAETDDVYVDAKDVSVSIKDVIETNKGAENSFEKLVADKTPVDTKVTDTEDTVTVKLTATPSTTEGGEITYTVTLVDAKGNPVDTKTGVTVELSNGKTITIDANSSSKSLTIDAETDDVYVDAKDVSVSIKDVIETNKGAENSFEKLVADKTPVDTKVTDTEDTVTVKLTATPSTTEGGEITYTVTLVDAKGNPVDTKTGVTVELSNGKTITIDANSSSKSLTIDAETDDVYVDAKDVSVSIKDVIETNKGAENSFEKLVADKTPVDTKVTDTEDTVTVKLTATPSTTEGGEITYTVTLVDAKGNPVDTKTGVTVELSNGKTITIDANSSSKSLTIDAETDDVYVDAKDVSVSIKDVIETNKGAENSFEKLVADKTPVDTKVTDTEDTVTVKLTATPSTTEGGEITYTVTLVDAKGNPVDTKTGVTVELSNGKTITIDANSSSKSLTIDAETDDVYVDAKDVSVSIKDVIETNKGAENSFEKLVADKTPVDTKVTDTEDTVTVKLTATPSTTEGGEITYTVTLVDAKGNPVDTKTGVTVELSNGKTITIDANSSSKSLTIDAETDDVYVDAKDVSVSIKDVIETNKGAENSFEKLVADKTPVDTKVTDTEDTVTVKLTATPSTTEGGEITYTVTLVDAKGNPVDTKTGVTVELSNGKTITIDANSSSKSLTIDAETDDVYVDAKDVSVSIKDVIETNKGAENSFEKLVADKTPVDTKVTDTEDTVTVKLTATPSTTEGGEITYTVTLVDAKGNPVDTKTGVTVELSNGKTITIDANSSSKSLTIDAETDDVYVDAKDVSVSIKDVIETNKGAENSFEKLVADKTPVDTKVTDTEDTVTVKLTATPSTTEGGEITYTVTLVDAKGNPVDTKTGVTVELSNGKTITIDANSSSKSLTIDAETDDVYVDAKDVSVSIKDVIETNKGAENSFEKLVADKTPVDTKVTDTEDTVTVKLTATPSTTEGGEITYTVTLVDAKGNPVDTKTGVTVELSNGKTITIDANSSSKSLTIDAETDDVYVDAKDVSVSIKDVIETNKGAENSFEKLVADKTPVDTKVTDTEDTVYVDVTASSTNLMEGAGVTYTVTLRNQDGLEVKNHGGLNITLSNGVKITIPAGQDSATSSEVKAPLGSNTIKVQTIVETATADSGKQFEDIQSGKTVTVNASSSTLKNDTAIATENGSENIASEDSLDTINGKNDGEIATGNVLANDDMPWYYKSISKITFEGKETIVKSYGNTEIVGKYGTLNISSNGEYTYKVNDDNSDVDALNVGDKLAEYFTYTTSNGKAAVLTVEVEGRNDAPIISKIETNGVTLTGIYNDYQSDNISENITAKDLIKKDGSNSYQFKNENNTLKMDLGTTKTNVDISYEGKNAGYKSILGYYEKNADGTIGNLKIIFVDGSDTSAKSIQGITGEIGFFLIPNGANNTNIMNIINGGNYQVERTEDGKIIFSGNGKLATASDVYYTDESLSTEKKDHTIALKSDNPNSIIIGFEDQPLKDGSTDFDYNDFVISVKFTPSESLTNKLFKNVDFSDVDDDNLSEATVTLTNAIDGDKINIAGDLKEGITYTTEYKDGKLIIKFSGIASHEAYEEALEAIRFSTKNSENERELKFEIEIKDPNGKTDKNSVVIIGKGFDNDTPTIGDERVETKEDISYTFSIKDFDSYKDVDGDSIETIKIVTLPNSKTEGTLKYDGVIITAGKEILVKDLGKLVFEPVLNSHKDASFTFQVSDSRGAYSDIKTMTVGVEAVADAPMVSIDIKSAGTIEVSVGTGNSSNSENNSNIKELNLLNTEKAVNDWGSNSQDIDKDLVFNNGNIDKTFQNFKNGSVTTGSGNDTLRFASVNDGKVINTGSGDDKVIFNQDSSVSLNLGNGNNEADFVGGFKGSVSSAEGNDKILINQSAEGTINLGEGNNTISIGRVLSGSVATGNGNDTLVVGQNVQNKSSIDLGEGNNTISIGGTFEGNILTGTGSDKIIINGNINGNGNSISTGAGSDFVQINGQVNNVNVNLGSGDDGIRFNPGNFNDFRSSTFDGGKGFDTLYLEGSISSYGVIDKQTGKIITWQEYVSLNSDAEGYANKEFYIYKQNTNQAITVKNIEQIVFSDETIGDKVDTTTVYKYDISLSAQLTDTDGSEKLSDVTLKNIPEGSKLFGADGKEINAKDNGTYTVKVDENGEAKLTLTNENEVSDTDLNSIKASATSNEVNENDEVTDSATSTVDNILSTDINLDNLSSIISENGEINLANGKAENINLTLDDVLKISGEDNTIKISGDKFDSVTFKNTVGDDGKENAWSKTEGTGADKGYDIYMNSGDPTVQVKVEQPISDGITN